MITIRRTITRITKKKGTNLGVDCPELGVGDQHAALDILELATGHRSLFLDLARLRAVQGSNLREAAQILAVLAAPRWDNVVLRGQGLPVRLGAHFIHKVAQDSLGLEKKKRRKEEREKKKRRKEEEKE